MEWQQKYQQYRKEIEAALPSFLPAQEGPQGRVAEAMAYSLLNGGKRIRGVLTLGIAELCGSTAAAAMPFAAAVEMVHAYSLIHDDLPCMDNDNLRRGKPSCHVQFDEATALLAGDALLTHAFEAMQRGFFEGDISADNTLKAIQALTAAAGVEGMIGGQQIDIEHENKAIEPDLLEEMHLLKTGALIRAAAKIGCLAAGASQDIVLRADQYAKNIGLSFQIVDDILDATKSSKDLGKSASDRQNGKTTYVTLYGEEKAREMVRRLVLEADLAIKGSILDDPFLYEFADELAKREK